MKTIVLDVTEAWKAASDVVPSLRFKVFEERLRHQCSHTNSARLPEGVTLFSGLDTDREAGHIYMMVEVME